MLIGRQVTVLGAGVAGLAVARALALRGAEVTVLEQAPEIAEVGAGLQISPNGACVLRALGLGEALAAAGQRAEAIELWDGPGAERVLRMDLARLRPGQDWRFVHRADLIDLLAAGAREAGVRLRLLQKVERVTLGPHRPRVLTAQGAEIEADLLIGADGLHSKLREALNGTVAPFFTHHAAWRATIPAEPGLPPVARVYMGPGRHLVTYPLRGGTLRNIVAVEERHRWVEESWSLTDDPIALRMAFARFAPEVRGWLDRVEAPALWGLFRHPVAQHWQASGSEGGPTGWGAAILGDAAHPTLPFLAQGAVMALEDAWVLCGALAEEPDLAAALARYEVLRRPRATRVVEAANANARNYHLSGLPRAVGHVAMRLAGRLAPGRVMDRFDWLYGFDVTA
ncbi:FAD-dependent oxidoreductase [Frigidibacter oleivorans]|uniref:FAD-dependent oxidoreductase n=1 Tax=Frigidibacter oleivorans TaxID=2487129 RepID=UPI000F8C5FF4|nr:FAD-dependent oxidoreductase [Frigidibacter oleivorans]